MNVFAEQQCTFVPKVAAHAEHGTCGDFFKNYDRKVHLTAVENRTCELDCEPGYAKTNGVFTCHPDDRDGRKTRKNIGRLEGSISCVGAFTSVAAEGRSWPSCFYVVDHA